MAGYIGSKSSVTLVDGYTEAEADAEFVAITGDSMTGGLTITTADNTNQLTIVSTDADANAGPNLNFRRNSASPADGDLTGQFTFTNNNDAGEGTDYATMYALSADVSNGSEDAAFYIKTMSAGTLRQRISLTDTATVFNEDSIDLDFRVESDNLTHALFVQGSDGNVGIGDSSPVSNNNFTALTITSTASTGGGQLYLKSSSVTGVVGADNATDAKLIVQTNTNHPIVFGTNGTERMRLDSSGILTLPRGSFFDGGSASFAIKTRENNANMLFQVIDNNNTITPLTIVGASGVKHFGTFQNENGGYNIHAGAGSTASFAARFDGTGTGASNVVQITNGYGEVGSIKIASNGTTTNYNTGSDYRLKTDVQPVTDASARIQSLNPVNFEWIRSGTRTDGFLAHEAQSVVPDCVSGTHNEVKVWEDNEELPDGVSVGDNKTDADGNTIPIYQGIDQSKLVPLLTAALQEALTEIASLKTRVEALEA